MASMLYFIVLLCTQTYILIQVAPPNTVRDTVPELVLENGQYSLKWNPYTKPTGLPVSKYFATIAFFI